MKKDSKLRGHPIYFNGEWRYKDNGEPTAENWKHRACGHCEKPNRPDEHDACLGELPGVINACCGHGNERDAYIMFEDETIKRGSDAKEQFNKLKNGGFTV